MSTAIQGIENVIKAGTTAVLTNLLKQVGMTIKVYRSALNLSSSTDEYEEAYGVSAGVEDAVYLDAPIKVITGLIMTDELIPIDDFTSGLLQGANLYSTDSVLPADTLVVERQDGTSKRFKVEYPEGGGVTTKILGLYRLSSLGD